jgi:hypothetical protein
MISELQLQQQPSQKTACQQLHGSSTLLKELPDGLASSPSVMQKTQHGCCEKME